MAGLGSWGNLLGKYFGIGGASVYKFGRNPGITSGEEVIWDFGGAYPWPTGVDTLSVSSLSPLDAAAGTGARTLLIQGLDANWAFIEELVSLNGVTPVITTKQFIRVFRAYNVTAGALEINQGDISIKHTTSTDTLAFIKAGAGQTLMAVYTVPAGKRAVIKRVGLTAGAGKAGVAYFRSRDNSIENAGIQLYGSVDIYQNQIVIDLPYPIEVAEKTDLWMSATSESAGTALTGTFNLVLYNV